MENGRRFRRSANAEQRSPGGGRRNNKTKHARYARKREGEREKNRSPTTLRKRKTSRPKLPPESLSLLTLLPSFARPLGSSLSLLKERLFSRRNLDVLVCGCGCGCCGGGGGWWMSWGKDHKGSRKRNGELQSCVQSDRARSCRASRNKPLREHRSGPESSSAARRRAQPCP